MLAWAQDGAPELVADRPGFGDSTGVVAEGHVGVEAGARADIAGENVGIALPQLLVRYGVLDGLLEVRAHAPDYAVFVPEVGDTDHGMGDAAAGIKLGFAASDSLGFSVVALGLFPVGTDGFSSESYGGLAELNWAWSSGGMFGVAGNVLGTFAEDPVDDGLTWSVAGSVAPGFSLTAVVGAYVEAIVVKAEDGDWTPYAGAGVTGLVTPSLQLDLYTEIGLSDDATDVAFGAGVATVF